MSPGFCAVPPGIFSVDGTTQITLTLGFSAARARMTPSMVAPPAMSYFIFSMPSGLDGDAARIKGDSFADETDDGSARLGIRRRVGDHHYARRLDAALGDAEQSAHF